VSVKIIMTTSVTRPCFTPQHQTCKTKTKTKTDILVSDRSCPKTDGLRQHACIIFHLVLVVILSYPGVHQLPNMHALHAVFLSGRVKNYRF